MIEKNIYRVSCDIKNCKHTAVYTFAAKGRLGKFYICSDCLKQLVEDFRNDLTPKSLKNPIKKALDDKHQGFEQG